MAKMVDANTLWKCETCFHHKNGKCSPEIWCENGEAYRPDRNKLTFVEATPVKYGRWIRTFRGMCESVNTGEMLERFIYKCPECDYVTGNQGEHFSFCPNCGTRMRGDQNG